MDLTKDLESPEMMSIIQEVVNNYDLDKEGDQEAAVFAMNFNMVKKRGRSIKKATMRQQRKQAMLDNLAKKKRKALEGAGKNITPEENQRILKEAKQEYREERTRLKTIRMEKK